MDQLGSLVRGVCPPAEEHLHASLKAPAFRRLHERSVSMHQQLQHLLVRLAQLRTSQHSWRQPLVMELATLASKTARLVASEMLDWRVVVLDRPLEPA